MAKAYRTATPYRKPQTYRGTELAVAPPPGTTAGIRAGWQPFDASAAPVRAGWEQATRTDAPVRAPHQAADTQEAAVAALWGVVAPRDAAVALPHAEASEAAQAPYGAPWGTPDALQGATALPHAETSGHAAEGYRGPWGTSQAHDRLHRLPYRRQAARALQASALWRALAARGALVALPWGPSGHRSRSYPTPWPVEPNPGEPGSDPLTAPILPVYVMLPTLSAVVLPDRTPLELLSASISTDVASWCWRFQAQIPLRELPLVNPAGSTDPVAIEVTVNGYAWTLLVEAHTDNRKFGVKTATIQGRSRSAMLAEPFAPVTSRIAGDDRNASQLADEELFGTGWTLLWDAVDWLVPGGTFTYADLAPIDAIGQLASVIGARVESHRSDLELAVKATHPTSPWEWDSATPYAILPAEICTVFDGQWQGGSNANGIYVYAQNSSFGALVRVTGTGGEAQLPMVVDQLLVSADPARERGRAELARSSKIKGERVVIPLFPSPADPGLIPVGSLVQVNESASDSWVGQVMGVQVTASRSGSALSVRQQLDVERHFR